MPEQKVRRHQDSSHLCWIDLEMTGLDPGRDVIVQVALIITDSELNILEEYVADIWQPEDLLRNMSPFVREMHEKTGLLQRVKQSKLEVLRAERELLERLTGWCTYPAILCGNTIAQDRRFIDRYMPGLAGYLHYRMLDVTAVKLVAQRWYGEASVFDKSKALEHDALFDIRNSIAELKHYRDTLFIRR